MKNEFRHIIWIFKVIVLFIYTLTTFAEGNDSILYYKFINTQIYNKEYLYPYEKQEIKVYYENKYITSIYYTLNLNLTQFLLKSNFPYNFDINKVFLAFEYNNLNCTLVAEPDSIILKNDTILIFNIKAKIKEISFEKKKICNNELDKGIKIYIPQFYNIFLYASDKNIEYDPITSSLKFGDIKEGTYYFEISSEYCLKNYYDSIKVFPSPVITLSEKDLKICPGTKKIISAISSNEDSLVTIYWSNDKIGSINEITQPGNYIVIAKNEYECITTDTVKVYEKTINIKKLEYSIKEVDCYNLGNLTLFNYEIAEGTLPFKFYLKNLTTNDTIYNLINLKEGKYKLIVKDFENCTTSYDQIIYVSKNCLNDYPILAPSIDRINNTYYIPYKGEAVVYDKNGLKKTSFQTPAYWDGNDSTGKPLPTGTYLIVIQDNIIEITIIR